MNLKDVSKALKLGGRRVNPSTRCACSGLTLSGAFCPRPKGRGVGAVEWVKDSRSRGISTDTRDLKRGDIFIAIKGERFDGHDFVYEAFRKGAISAVVEHKITGVGPESLIIVKDTLKALGDIARYNRMRFRIPVIGVTGSAGKTMVKEIISHILSERYAVLKNEGTRNNLIGLPLTLMSLDKKYDMAVLEMGTSRPGEIKRLSYIAGPATAVFTNIAESHLEGLKSVNKVLKAKSEMLPFVRGAILNIDDPLLAGLKTACGKIYYGIEKKCDFQAGDIKKENGAARFRVNKAIFRIHLLGRHNIYNALAGIAVGKIYGLKLNTIADRLDTFRNPFDNRLALSENGGLKILNDTYNSNPLSFKRAIDVLRQMGGSRKIVISGDMLELGTRSAAFHKELGGYIALAGIERLITLGEMSRYIGEGAVKMGIGKERVAHYSNAGELMKDLPFILKPKDIVLIKGSRAAKMEDIAGFIKLKMKNARLNDAVGQAK